MYDDKEWFIRELIESYKLTGKEEYLEKAEYLTDYVLDGWYRTETTDGGNKGGIPWGPGYTSKHTCSNGPMISPLVWLYEIYKDKPDEITCKTIDAGGARIERTEAKKDYYLNTAKMLYGWTKANLLRSDGLYHDATWTDDPRSSDGYCCEGSGAEGSCIPTETAGGVLYRKPSVCVRPGGSPLSYNIGSVLSGAADLYRVTKDGNYLTDAEALSQKSFAYFAKPNATKQGYDTWAIDGFNNWFNGVLMRAYVDAYPFYSAAAEYAGSFQKNLDYGYDNYLYRGFLPTNLLLGWGSNAENRKVNAHFIFAFAAEYAVLAKLELMKGQR